MVDRLKGHGWTSRHGIDLCWATIESQSGADEAACKGVVIDYLLILLTNF